MKGVKGLLLFLSALFVNLVSAYGEEYGMIIGGVYVDTELVFAAILFLLFFLCLMITTRKMNLFQSDMVRIVVSMILSLFGIYGLQKAGVDFSKIVYDIGIEKFLMQNFPIILLAISVIAMIFWGLGTVLMLWGGIFVIAGLAGSINEDIVYNWELTLIIGFVLFLIGLAINRKAYKRLGNISFGSRNIFNSIRRLRRRINKLQKIYEKLNRKGEYEKANKVLEQIRYLQERLRFLEEKNNKETSSTENPPSNQPVTPQGNPNANQMDKINLARRIGLKNLEKEKAVLTKKLTEGWAKAEKLHKLSTSKSGGQWTKSKEGRKYYKDWFRQYQENIITEKRIKELTERIIKLQSKIN